jgi:hypothetical protein
MRCTTYALAIALAVGVTVAASCSGGEPAPVQCVDGGDPGTNCTCVGGEVVCGFQPALVTDASAPSE